jgi:hypothetical protein
MAVEVFGVTTSDVIARLPFDGSQIGANSKVTTSDLTGYIEDAASQLVGHIKAAGLSPGGLDDDTAAQMRAAVCGYAVAQVLDRLAFSGAARDNAMRKFEEARQRYANAPNSLAGRPATHKSNISRTKSARQFGSDFEW